MTSQPYREISVEGQGAGAGFQFEFRCEACDRRWQSPVRRYRTGQFTSLVVRAAHLARLSLPGSWMLERVSAAGNPRAHADALADARAQAQAHFRACSGCGRHLCTECFGAGLLCPPCLGQAPVAEAGRTAAAPGRHGVACPACQTLSDGGRFCPECGFDLASTHKSCPACSAQLPRQANYCPDCGHSF